MNVSAFPLYAKSDPQFYYSKNKTLGSPLVVFVHFYGGQQRVLKRHIQLVNDLGYDAFGFNMPQFAGLKLSLFYKGRFGLKHLYARMLAYFLDQIPGQKIIYVFSNPSAAAIEVIYDRTKEQQNDVSGLICDSGPSMKFIQSAWNLAIRLTGQYKLMGLFSGFWSLLLHQEIRFQLKRFPKSFPILSIRGGQDPVIPAWHIEKVFRGLDEYIQVQSTTFAEAGHLDALKKFPESYKETLSKWLQAHYGKGGAPINFSNKNE